VDIVYKKGRSDARMDLVSLSRIFPTHKILVIKNKK